MRTICLAVCCAAVTLGWLVGGALSHDHEVDIVAGLAAKYHGETEVRLWDGTRVDLLTPTEAIEADWAPKWAEAVGQALYYAELTGRRPAIILLTRDATDDHFVYRCQTLCAKHGIRLYVERTL